MRRNVLGNKYIENHIAELRYLIPNFCHSNLSWFHFLPSLKIYYANSSTFLLLIYSVHVLIFFRLLLTSFSLFLFNSFSSFFLLSSFRFFSSLSTSFFLYSCSLIRSLFRSFFIVASFRNKKQRNDFSNFLCRCSDNW